MNAWREEGLAGGLVNVWDGLQHIAVFGDHRENGERALTQARLAVRAVNSHARLTRDRDALLAACKAVTDLATELIQGEKRTNRGAVAAGVATMFAKIARAAITAAEAPQ